MVLLIITLIDLSQSECNINADYRLYLAPKTQISGDFQFNFTSSDCLRIGLNSDGYIEGSCTLVGTTETKYSITIDDCNVFAKGEFLWKVRKYSKQYKYYLLHKESK